MRILVFHTKYQDLYYDASDYEAEKRSFLAAFYFFDNELQYYDAAYMDENEKELYLAAKGGDAIRAKVFIHGRSGCEYEGFEHQEIENTERDIAEYQKMRKYKVAK